MKWNGMKTNGIEIGKDDDPILSFSEQKSLKKSTFIYY
ncbi:N(5)-(carboxyethyl)ornithine synthase [Lactococcus lactis subsp. lactis]|uniref:N(5)-(Carboxyethyl)ornithine synthase n=1 Tax=Lactococcus lactis subsp. lactis TaxID=1360 RepID=A0A2R7Y0S7_LACLL|nr:N(5)-(carboxyethyl)ornithine synthase [Lactococcus lactis subsp. lactis]